MPNAIAKPNIIIPFTLIAAFKAAKAGRLGVVIITTSKYVIKEIDPAINPLFNAILLIAKLDLLFISYPNTYEVLVRALLLTSSLPKVVSLADIFPLSPFSTSTKPKSARPFESFAP